MTLAHERKYSGGNFLILNLQAVTMVECRHFEKEQKRHQATVFFNDRAWVKLVGADADRVAALEIFAGHLRLASQASFHPTT
jgi:hypothetical protein